MKHLKPLLLIALSIVTLAAAQPSGVTIQHDEGATTVPSNPKRVVVISEEMLDFAFALKLNVIGVGSPRLTPSDLDGNKIRLKDPNAGFFRFGNVQNLTYVGNWAEPSLETILTLKPDLILRLAWTGIQGFDKLSAIAPTVSFGQNRADGWQSILLELSKINDRQSVARAFIADYNAKLAAAQSKLAAAGILRKTPKFMVISTFGSGTSYLYTGNRLANVMRGLGFTFAYPTGLSKTEEDDKFGWQTLSPEVLLTIPSDTLVVNVPNIGATTDPTKLEGNVALLRKSKARVVDYNLLKFSPWMGPNTDKQMIADLSKAILNVKP